jgi:deoxyribose-phosphate aldolase
MSKQLQSWDKTIARVIDHTVLGAAVNEEHVARACEEARHYGFATVVAPPEFLRAMVRGLGGSGVRVCTVIAFPDGEGTPEDKVAAAKRLISRGADELDVVMNVGAFLGGRIEVVTEEIARLAEVCRKRAVLKLIIETPKLDAQQIVAAARLAADGGVDFVKTGTGTAGRGVTVEDVTLIRDAVAGKARIKASGGIRTAAFARELLDAGAHRLGTSASLQILGLSG